MAALRTRHPTAITADRFLIGDIRAQGAIQAGRAVPDRATALA